MWEVRSVTDYTGELFIFDLDNENKCIHIEVVDLPGPPFSPDISNIDKWEDIVDTAIDNHLQNEGEK